MPGLAGFTNADAPPEASLGALKRMRELLAHGESRHQDRLFSDGRLYATRSHTSITQPAPQPFEKEGVRVWLDGEFYNREELERLLDAPARGAETPADASLLAALHRQDAGGDFGFLRHVDGIYSAVIYDALARRVHFVSDRYGLRRLFWTRHGAGVAWGSEVKAMLGLHGFEPKIDRASLRDFFDIGHLRGARTWLEGVELLPAATVLSWNLEERTASARRYWDAEEIKALPEEMEAVELAEELGRLFRAAVERRSSHGERTGLTLSGGLDSRAILAAMPERGGPLHAVTFGKLGCEDALVAALAAAAKGARHHAWELNAAGWLEPRFEGVWWTDGELDLMHMHVVAIVPRARELFQVALDGCGANGIIGDSWMEQGLSGPREYIEGRTRRFLVLGPVTVRGFVEERFPFFDNSFVELALAAPDSLKAHNALYRMMLLRTFPEFFERIPWQKTGQPISWPSPDEARASRKSLSELKDVLLHKLSWYGLASPPARGYADYPNWMRQEPARSLMKELLLGASALYPEFVPRERVEGALAKHFGGRDRSEFLGRVLTLEVWLRQVFEGELRAAPCERAELAEAR
ncbi:MAG TPA: asparagine synthase-related protein [Pyrinomonadaceae bacterium]|nr:asparagine synthase-related protein [Pyrinomonadaceae bacterium]